MSNDAFAANSSVHRDARRHAASRTDEYLYSQLIPYIGNKRKLLPLLLRAIHSTGVKQGVFLDLFGGSGVVSRLAKSLGMQVLANDWEPYALHIARCFVECNTAPPFANLGGASQVLGRLNALPGREGYITRHLCPHDDERPDTARERMFFTRRNGLKMDAMREQIATWETEGLLSQSEKSFLLAPFCFALSYVSNTSGVFKGFHNGWGGATQTALYRIRSDVFLRAPILFDNHLPNRAFGLDALDLARALRDEREQIDIAYLDPPYNQHPYGSNYHVLNTLVLWDKPALSRHISRGDKSAIRTDWRTERRSAYNYATATEAYADLIQAIDARWILTSYSTDGNIPLAEMLRLASARGALSCVFDSYKRYRVSSQRMSTKPLNVEFVLIIDTQSPARAGDAERIESELRRGEEDALGAHPKSDASTCDVNRAACGARV